MRRSISVLVYGVAFLLALSPMPARAQQTTGYERRELIIPVRDGVHLFAVALIPRDATQPLPVILVRTPFSAAGTFRTAELPLAYRDLGADGYIFVVEDIRGRFRSDGEFVVSRAQHDPRNPAGTNESTDAYDTIDWLIKNLTNNNGKVGVLGISYPGWLAALAGVGAHPALKAISPQGLIADAWLGDDFFHQGAFRQSQGTEFAAFIDVNPKSFNFLSIPDYDHYTYYLKHQPLDSLAVAAGVAGLPSWVEFSSHPSYDEFWQAKALQNVLTRPEVPLLFVGGFWDQEDILGPQIAYRTVEKSDTRDWNNIVLGPWWHGGWARSPGDSLGPIALGSRTGEYFLANVQRPWFNYYLHGKGDGNFPEAWAFETGENKWHTFAAWPPRNAQPRKIFLRENGRISFDPPPARVAEYDSYVSDPARPVPYMTRPDNGEGWTTWLEQDQRFVHNRPDVLSWESEPLAEDITIAGDVVAHLFASTTGTDADWVVKLIDVYPDSVPENSRMGGYQFMVNADIMRGRYWKGVSQPTPVSANAVTSFDVDLHQQLYRFLKGHRLMVQVQSTWFPLYDRNPQTFVPNIFHAKAADFRAQEHRVWHTPRYPSHISVLVLPPL
ncbi:MAG: CocE/NonD family hydrolase [Gemmatimonadota bacterium]